MTLYKLKMTIRNARKNGVLSFAKIFGLSLSFAVILFAIGYVYFETSFDKSIPDYDKIYRCLMQGQLNEEKADYAVTSPAQATAITGEISEIEEATRILNRGNASLKIKENLVNGGPLFYADPNIFSFFMVQYFLSQSDITLGTFETNMENPLSAENYLVISKSIAENQFGSVENALGKTVDLRGENCIITGVFNDLPVNFHLQISLFQSIQKSNPDQIGWSSQNYYTYFKTNRPNMDVDELNFKISKLVYSHTDDRINVANATTIDDLKYADNFYVFYICEPLKDIHFSNHKFDPAKTSNKTYVYGAVIMALLVLLISFVNFINLTIANISTRFKEMGIRKTIGAFKKDIVKQFLYETLVFFILSFLLAVLIYLGIGNPVAQYLGFNIHLSDYLTLKIVAVVFIALLVFNLTVNIFPIVITSNKNVLGLIKNESTVKRYNWKNNSFILVQFVLSGLIILSSVFVQKQIDFMVNKDRGYNGDNVLMLSMWTMSPLTRQNFIDKLKSYNSVMSVSTSDVYFGEDFSMNDAYFQTREDENYFHTSNLPADDEFLNTFGFKMKEGRYFEKERQTDFDAVILNESAVKEYTGSGSLVGTNLIIGEKIYQVIGIVNDFNFRSLHHKIEPLVMTRIENFGNIFVKVRNKQIPEVLATIKTLWNEFKIDFPLNYEFHDEVLAQHYVKDQQAKRLLLLLSVISIIIACVGLYAVCLFTIIRKTKEIGIRKVNGARTGEVIAMLNKDFIQWVVMAFVIATPIAYFAMNLWLQNFAYKTTLSWWVFVAAEAITIGIALFTVSFQSWRAARRNPVEALRYE